SLCCVTTYIGCIFFFQAEDGIRDFHVTGVQTCALPILRVDVAHVPFDRPMTELLEPYVSLEYGRYAIQLVVLVTSGDPDPIILKIGRASCRERASVSVVAVDITITKDGERCMTERRV